MYDNENSRSYFFRNLIVKILLVLLFVFLLMWLIPMPNLNPFYDKIFTQNVSSMTDAAKAYFTTARLPQEDGETKKLTLQDMLDNKMIIEFTDSDGKKCDTEKSYVEVTKKDGEYIYKTNLSCPSDEDYVIEYFGCYDVCEDGSCKTKTVNEFQFYKNVKQSYISGYTCKSGYTLSGTSCVSKTCNEVSKNANPVCDEGYSYNASTGLCEKQNTETSEAKLTCKSGYTYDSGSNKCIKTSNYEKAATISSYVCKEGVLDGTKCVVKAQTTVDAKANSSCPSGYTPDGNTCKKTVTNTTYTCSSGSLSGTQCAIYHGCTNSCTSWACSTVTYNYTMSTASTSTFTRSYLYPSGTKYVYEECTRNCSCTGGGYTYVAATPVTKTEVVTANPTITYTCPSSDYTLNGSKCTLSADKVTDATPVYTCAEGKLSGKICKITKTESTNVIYGCDLGVVSENKCVITTTDSRNVVNYTCDAGYTYKDGKCFTTQCSDNSIKATAVYKNKTVKTYKWSTEESLPGWTKTGEVRTRTVEA